MLRSHLFMKKGLEARKIEASRRSVGENGQIRANERGRGTQHRLTKAGSQYNSSKPVLF